MQESRFKYSSSFSREWIEDRERHYLAWLRLAIPDTEVQESSWIEAFVPFLEECKKQHYRDLLSMPLASDPREPNSLHQNRTEVPRDDRNPLNQQ